MEKERKKERQEKARKGKKGWEKKKGGNEIRTAHDRCCPREPRC